MKGALAKARKCHQQNQKQWTENDRDGAEDRESDVVELCPVLPQGRCCLRCTGSDDRKHQIQNPRHSHQLHRIPETPLRVETHAEGDNHHEEGEDDENVNVAERCTSLRLENAGSEFDLKRIVKSVHIFMQIFSSAATTERESSHQTSSGNSHDSSTARDRCDDGESLNVFENRTGFWFRKLRGSRFSLLLREGRRKGEGRRNCM